ncbi:Predicted peptidase [Streptococcus henryi]|uniref:Predicted peptidase n=1 Tax=Streptococcus henryi TaxID=439219 RepID=A0A1G6C1T0_9STRE|nr:PHB depolymerase family esterase [Streptococcus henryi]SDB26807.1 Predicted peptidase [Streptococcus henryi]
MKNASKIVLCLLLAAISLSHLLQVEARQWPGYPSRTASVTKTSLYIDNYEFGPAVSKVILELNTNITSYDLSSTTVTTSDINRQIQNAYLSDANGQATATGAASKYLTLELDVTYNTDNPSQSASPFSFDLSTYRNTWVSSYVVAINGLSVKPAYSYKSQTINSEQEAISNRLTPKADKFSERGQTYGLQYAAYQPESAVDGEKNPLIIWLHGIGEVGTDLNFPLLSSEVSSLTESGIQNHFTSTGSGNQNGAYVLVVQSPVAWGSGQAAALKSTIDDYVASHPDIDSERIYLAGASNGGGMVVTMGITYPNYFAALIPIAASYPYQASYDSAADLFTYTVTDSTYQALKDQPMWLIHSRADQTVPVDNSVLPFYKAMIDRGTSNKWLSYYETATGTELPGLVYNGHWSWIYFFNNQVTGVQSTENTASYQALWGMVATDPTQGGASKATVNGIEYSNLFDWLNAQRRP